jgi:hypothetical protein
MVKDAINPCVSSSRCKKGKAQEKKRGMCSDFIDEEEKNAEDEVNTHEFANVLPNALTTPSASMYFTPCVRRKSASAKFSEEHGKRKSVRSTQQTHHTRNILRYASGI